MFKNPSKLLVIAVLAMSVSSCYNGARTENMTVARQANAEFGKYSHNIILLNAQNDTRWDRRASDDNFKHALENSLYANDLINNDNGKYTLSANIVELTPPEMGFNLHVTSDVHYVIRDKRNDAIIVDKTIETRAAASENDDNMITGRKRLVDERALNQNIRDFINYLRK